MSRNSLHSALLVVLTVAVSGLLVAVLSGPTSAQTAPGQVPDSGKDIVMLRCSLAEDFSTVSAQSSVDVGVKKGISCPANVAMLTRIGFQSRFIAASDIDKGYFVMMLSR